MSPNVGTADRVIRIVLGIAMIAYAVLAVGSPYNHLGWIGILPILTAFVSFCPLYTILGLRSNVGK